MSKNNEQLSEKTNASVEELELKNLILHNDDFNTFDFVTDTLIDVCKHKEEQALQCTYLVHYTGKAEVKSGSYTFLKPIKTTLLNLGLSATIE